MTRRRRVVLPVLGLVLALAVCAGGIAVAATNGDDGPSPSRAATDRDCERPYVRLDPRRPRPKDGLSAKPIGAARAPAVLALDPTRPGRAFLGERAGRVRAVDGVTIGHQVVPDLSHDTQREG